MTAMDTDDLAVVTGPLSLFGDTGSDEDRAVFLEHGEVVRIEEGQDWEGEGISYVYGLESELLQYIDSASLTPLDEISSRTDIQWGDEADAVVQG